MKDVLLEANNLVRHFKAGDGLFSRSRPIRAVDGVSLAVRKGETYAIVGESGCGKSTLARLLTRLIDVTSGEIAFDGRAIHRLHGASLRRLRQRMQFIFQDPFSSLNPRLTVGRLIAEPLETHFPQLKKKERRERVNELLSQVGLRPEHGERYPHEFSGGQRQRIGIARALASGPDLVIGDEPVSALDVSVQAQIVNLLADLRDRLGLTLVVIAHDLAVIRHMSDRVAVMYLGQIVEEGPTDTIFDAPRHPYTMALLSSIPVTDPRHARNQITLIGEMPSPADPPPGCRFHTRCPFAKDHCGERAPNMRPTGVSEGHRAACHYFEEIARDHPPEGIPDAPLRSAEAEERFRLYRDAVEPAGDPR